MKNGKNNPVKVGLLPLLAVLVLTCTPPRQRTQPPPAAQSAFNAHPSPAYLSPEESLKTMHLPEGYHLELVASEPLIKEPVAIAWDGNGRMYVAEMLTYMQDADATGEQNPVSRISRLEDTDHDGKMDKSSVFIDQLLLPRMIQCVNDELLVNETNTITIHSYKDTDGDGKADQKKVLYQNDNYVMNDANMEHQRSGLDWNLDNWMYITYDPVRFRYTNGTMRVDTIVSGSSAQWGLTHDNYGRLFYSSAGGERPAVSFQINPVYGRLEMSDQYNEEFQEVWPIVATPDVQGGFKRLRSNVTLNHFTGACGQSIYRGDRLPADLVGDYIVCEPVGRIVRRAKVKDQQGKTVLENAYHQREFIASTDLNFRPVNSATGPDGNLYLVDMHRGIIQQANWTKPGSFIRSRIDSLGLANNTGHGRIYRVVHDEYKRGPKPNMLTETPAKLLPYLGHPNGWWRDNAQKQLIVRGDQSIVPALKQMATQLGTAVKQPDHLAVIHALWTLEGLESIDQETLRKAFRHPHPQVRRTAVWISETYLKKNDLQMIAAVGNLINDPDYGVRVQLLLSLYNVKSERAKTIVTQLLASNPDNEMLAATKAALDKNEDVRTFGDRLGNMPKTDRELILNGAAIFKSLCGSCHGPEGKGIATGGGSLAAPPLVKSKRMQFPEKNAAIRIVLHGLSGPVDGKTYSSIMPSMSHNSDEWVASVVSYIRYQFGEPVYQKRVGVLSPVITPEEVRNIRQQEPSRTKAWTLAELETKSKEELAAQEAENRKINPGR